MKPLQISQDIVPLARFKTQASQIFRRMHDEQRPVVVTQNGQPAAVLITPEEFDRLKVEATSRGISYVQSGPLVRSSYRAEEPFEKVDTHATA